MCIQQRHVHIRRLDCAYCVYRKRVWLWCKHRSIKYGYGSHTVRNITDQGYLTHLNFVSHLKYISLRKNLDLPFRKCKDKAFIYLKKILMHLIDCFICLQALLIRRQQVSQIAPGLIHCNTLAFLWVYRIFYDCCCYHQLLFCFFWDSSTNIKLIKSFFFSMNVHWFLIVLYSHSFNWIFYKGNEIRNF